MSNTSNNLAIYLIVLCNALCHLMLIWRLKLDQGAKVKFCSLALGIPVAVMCVMRLMVALGVVHARLAEQSGPERALTLLASVLLLAGPVFATGAAVLSNRKGRLVAEEG